MNNLRLRKATADDSEFAYQTKKAAFMEYVEKVWGWNAEEQRQMHSKRFASQEFQVIQVSGNDIGVLALDRQPESIKINQIFIKPEYQSRGIGTACMKRIIEEVSVSKLPIRLTVLKINNRAITFYKRLGFKISGETDIRFVMERVS